MKILSNETKIVTSNADKVIVTNYRIYLTDQKLGQSYTSSIFLEDISSIEIKYSSNIVLLALGVIGILIGFLVDEMILGFVAGVLFTILWWISRKHVIAVSPNGGSPMNILVQGMGEEKIADFVYKVSLAKQNRLNELYKI